MAADAQPRQAGSPHRRSTSSRTPRSPLACSASTRRHCSTAAPAGPPIARDGTLAGALFESLVTLSLRTYAQAAEATVKHLRTAGGRREVDLIVERPDGRVVAVEVKLTRDSQGPRHDASEMARRADR